MSPLTSNLTYNLVSCNNCRTQIVNPESEKTQLPCKKGVNWGCGVFFPFSWSGFLSNKGGLQIYTPQKKLFRVLNSGEFKITFKQGEIPEITSIAHECSFKDKLSKDSIVKLIGLEDDLPTPSQSDKTSNAKTESAAKKVLASEEELNEAPAKKQKQLSANHS